MGALDEREERTTVERGVMGLFVVQSRERVAEAFRVFDGPLLRESGRGPVDGRVVVYRTRARLSRVEDRRGILVDALSAMGVPLVVNCVLSIILLPGGALGDGFALFGASFRERGRGYFFHPAIAIRAISVVVPEIVEESLSDIPVFARAAAESAIKAIIERAVGVAALALIYLVSVGCCRGGSWGGCG